MSPATVPQVTFDRHELNRILTLYGRMVFAGEWRDYALDFLDDVAIISIFRRSRKCRFSGSKNGPGCVTAKASTVWRRWAGRSSGVVRESAQVLRIYDRKLLRALSQKE